MKLKVFLVTLLLLGTLTFVRCQDDEGLDVGLDDFDEDEDMDVEVEEEDDVPVEQVDYSPPEPMGPHHLAEPFDSTDVLGSK